MNIPLADLKKQYKTIQKEIDIAVQRVLETTSFILGEEVEKFEKNFASFVNAQGCVGVASGTAALQLALLACDVGAGDEVITSAHTFTATAEAISHTGAKPVFVDINPHSFNIEPNCIEEAINTRTKAIIPVHLYGQPADMHPIMDIANRNNLFVIEDAAQAHGAVYKGQPCGCIGHLACFSFYPGKNLGAYGDAGAVTGNDEILLERVKKLRDHGRRSKYVHEVVGYGERLDALQAAILDVKLKHLDGWIKDRQLNAELYSELLSDMPIITPNTSPVVQHAYHLYVIRIPNRDDLRIWLEKNGVCSGVHYPLTLHKQPAYLSNGNDLVNLPNTEKIAEEILSLPMYPELSKEQILHIVGLIKLFRVKEE